MSRISFPIQITLKDFDDITYNAIYGVRSKSQTGNFSGIDSMYFVVILDLEIIFFCSKQLKPNEYHTSGITILRTFFFSIE